MSRYLGAGSTPGGWRALHRWSLEGRSSLRSVETPTSWIDVCWVQSLNLCCATTSSADPADASSGPTLLSVPAPAWRRCLSRKRRRSAGSKHSAPGHIQIPAADGLCLLQRAADLVSSDLHRSAAGRKHDPSAAASGLNRQVRCSGSIISKSVRKPSFISAAPPAECCKCCIN